MNTLHSLKAAIAEPSATIRSVQRQTRTSNAIAWQYLKAAGKKPKFVVKVQR